MIFATIVIAIAVSVLVNIAMEMYWTRRAEHPPTPRNEKGSVTLPESGRHRG